MALRHRHLLAAIGLLALALSVAFASAGPTPAEAGKKRACVAWGKASPTNLETGQARKAVLCLLNKKRRAHGLPALNRSSRLEEAAQRHSDRMDGTGCFSHECPGEPTLESRLEGVNYIIGGLLRWAFGENIAWGESHQGSPKAIVGAWMNSSGHRANILNRSYRHVGVGFTRGTPSSAEGNGGIYTTDFGFRAD
ncbi:MAG TPA: CAP domain-containing protein [Solirubrobacterales bacterium]|nr:CAP domain-containing protein [Solirubrobacterales bacterium]